MAVTKVTVQIDGKPYSLTYSEGTGKWSASLTAPGSTSFNLPGGYYPVTITALDDAGNSTTINDQTGEIGKSLRLQVKEQVKPTITITAPASNAYLTTSRPTVKAQYRDEGSGVAKSSIRLQIDDKGPVTPDSPGVTVTPVTGGFDVTYTPQSDLQDGPHTITANGADNDGNIADEASSTFTLDTIAPSLDVAYPPEGLITNQTTITVSGTSTDITSGLSTVTIQVNENAPITASVGPDGAFSQEITLKEGSNTIKITATDKIGKATEIIRTVTVNTIAPIIRSVTITPTRLIAAGFTPSPWRLYDQSNFAYVRDGGSIRSRFCGKAGEDLAG